MNWSDPADYDLPVTVCATHQRFLPCRPCDAGEEGWHTADPEHVAIVREHHEEAT